MLEPFAGGQRPGVASLEAHRADSPDWVKAGGGWRVINDQAAVAKGCSPHIRHRALAAAVWATASSPGHIAHAQRWATGSPLARHAAWARRPGWKPRWVCTPTRPGEIFADIGTRPGGNQHRVDLTAPSRAPCCHVRQLDAHTGEPGSTLRPTGGTGVDLGAIDQAAGRDLGDGRDSKVASPDRGPRSS